MAEGDRGENFDGVAVERSPVDASGNRLVLLHENCVKRPHDSRISARQKRVLHSYFAFEDVDPHSIIFIDRNGDGSRLTRADDRRRSIDALLRLVRIGAHVNSHPPRDYVKQITCARRILPEHNSRIAEQIEAAAAAHFKVRVTVIAGRDHLLNWHPLSGTDGPRHFIPHTGNLAAHGRGMRFVHLHRRRVDRSILRACSRSSSNGDEQRRRDRPHGCLEPSWQSHSSTFDSAISSNVVDPETNRRDRQVKIALLSCIFGVLFLREPKCFTHPEFFADDAAAFFQQQLILGPRAIFQTWSQYLHIVPRLLALLATVFPIAWAPLVYAIQAIIVSGLCCWGFCLDEFRPVLRSDALRIVLCILPALAFPAQELVGDITNLQWFLTMFAVPLTLLPPKSRSQTSRILLLLLGLLIALSGPITIILLPVIALYGIRRSRLTEFQIGLTTGTLVEWAVIAAHWLPRTQQAQGFAAINSFVFSILVAFTNQIAMFCLLGRPITKAVWDHTYRGVSLVLLLTLACSLVALYMRGGPAYRERVRLMLWLIFSSIVLANLRGMEATYPDMSSVQPWGAHRYFFLACWCFAFLVLFTIEHYKPAWPAYQQCALGLAIFSVGIYGNFRLAPHAITDWKNYVPEIEAWQADRKAGREHAEVVVPVSPAGWAIRLPKLQRTVPRNR